MNSICDPCMMVIFGGSGDLTFRKLIPALYHIDMDGLLPENFAVVACAREEISEEAYRDRVDKKVAPLLSGERPAKLDQERWSAFLKRFRYLAGDVTKPETFDELRKLLDQLDKERGTGGCHIFYLATQPGFFGPTIRSLGKAGLLDEENGLSRRVVVEKPFGHDLESARALNAIVRETMREDQIFRIDHYLGKETVQNIMVLRFSNEIFEPIWNRGFIDSVQITVAETLGVESRASYYEQSGALRDMVPNHLFQILSMIAMEPPNSFRADDVRDEKNKILKAIEPLTPEEVLTNTVRGQYGPGTVLGKSVPGYRSEEGVNPESKTETFSAMRFSIDNWRWAGVPFYLRTGKRLAQQVTEVCIQFKRPPLKMFEETQVASLSPNRMILYIQPEERISMQFGAKIPGQIVHIGDVAMDFDYKNSFGNRPQTGYETLIYDCMKGDATLFQRADHVETAWSVITPILDVWNALHPREFPNYGAGTWGPAEADELLAREGRNWRLSGRPPGLPRGRVRAA